MSLRLATGQQYACQKCGRCCRRFLVQLSSREVEAISRLPWEDPELRRIHSYRVLGGRSYLMADAATARCVFLGEGDLCRMHAAFGGRCKPISCQAYPFAFQRTFEDEITAAPRFDCPSVQQNQGFPLVHYRVELETLLEDPLMPPLPPPFTETQKEGLTRQAIQRIADFLAGLLHRPVGPEAPSLPALQTLVQRLRTLGAGFLNDHETLETVLPSMLQKAMTEHPQEEPIIGILWPERVRLRQRMLDCLRFDRQLPDFSLSARLRQCLQNGRFLWGFGNPRDLGPDLPEAALHRAGLFENDRWKSAPDTWECYRRCLAIRLETRQFFGAAYYGRPFFTGLEALLDTWKTAVLLARIHAVSRKDSALDASDGQFATGLLDHIHGRMTRGTIL